MNLIEYGLYWWFGVSSLMAFYGLGQLALMSTKRRWDIVKDFKMFVFCVFIGFIMFLMMPGVMLYHAIKICCKERG